jgi:hypothetical protein
VVRRRAFVLLSLAGCVPGAASSSREPPPAGDEPPDPRTPEPERPAPVAAGDSAAALDARVEALRREYAAAGYVVLAEPPFAVVGDESRARVQAHAEGTVRWAMARLREFFPADPNPIVDVWLFGTETSYRRGARQVFGDVPDTPYGYYSPEHEALIMNIGSGGGTLVHEMVHPLMAANFPKCPAWFNEGLASLYEQCGDRDGKIWGFTNWRLPGLQEALAAGDVPSFETLLATTEGSFYGDDPGTNYAQARYLCMWLQEHGLLRPFFHDFVAGAGDDPTGIATLRHHVGDDLVAFQRQWSNWVTRLRFPT